MHALVVRPAGGSKPGADAAGISGGTSPQLASAVGTPRPLLSRPPALSAALSAAPPLPLLHTPTHHAHHDLSPSQLSLWHSQHNSCKNDRILAHCDRRCHKEAHPRRSHLVLTHVEVALNGRKGEKSGAVGLRWQRQLMRHISLGHAPEEAPLCWPQLCHQPAPP